MEVVTDLKLVQCYCTIMCILSAIWLWYAVVFLCWL